MSSQGLGGNSFDQDGRVLLRTGAIAAFLVFTGYLLTFPVYAVVGYYPAGAEARLVYFSNHASGWWIITGLMVATDLLIIPVFIAIYRAVPLRRVVLLAVACQALFVAVDLAVTWTAHTALITLGKDFASAAADAQRTTLVAAAGYPSSVLDSPLLGIIIILIPSLGILLATVDMPKTFSKSTVILGWAAGLTGLIAGFVSILPASFRVAPVLNAFIIMIWYLMTGLKLFRLSRP